MPDEINDKITDEQMQWLVAFIERERAREEERKIEEAERREIRNAIIQKLAAGSAWGIISFFVMKIVNKYW